MKPAEAASAADAAAQARERILAVIRAIPRGQVMGYGQVAAKAGDRKSTRLNSSHWE